MADTTTNNNNQYDIVAALTQQNLITAEQAEQIRTEASATGKPPHVIIAEQDLVDTEKLTQVRAELHGMEYVSLLEKEIPKDTLTVISEDVAKNYKIICFNKEDNRIDVGLVETGNMKAMEAINFLANKEGFQVHYFLISEESFKRALRQYQSITEEVGAALEAQEQENKEFEDKEKEDAEEVIKAAPISKIVSVVLRHAVEGKASDIHIEPFRGQSRVRYRIDGILHTSLVLPINVHASVVARIKVLANLKLDETRIPQDGRIRLTFGDRRIDFRVSVLPLVETEKVVMRILDVSRGAPKLEDLGYEGRNLKIIKKNIKKTDGMFLVTGPTGSGKSTTIFSALSIVTNEDVNISTLEDPVEYFLEGANQSQIRSEIGFTFATGLRALLRQDPDIIMVGEIRDNETGELAIHAALTGHMVLSTLHTNDALGAVPRLIDMHVEPFLLASTLNGVLAQRLVRRICPHCKEKEELSAEMLADVRKEVQKMYEHVSDDLRKLFDTTVLSDGPESKEAYIGKGCPRCGNTGYKGRISISEVLDITDELRSMIANKEELSYTSDILAKQDFITVKQDGIIRALQGITSFAEILRVMSD